MRGINKVDVMHMMVDTITRRSQGEVKDKGDLKEREPPMGLIVEGRLVRCVLIEAKMKHRYTKKNEKGDGLLRTINCEEVGSGCYDGMNYDLDEGGREGGWKRRWH